MSACPSDKGDLDGWKGRVLILRAQRDQYYPASEQELLEQLYPNARVEELGPAGQMALLADRAPGRQPDAELPAGAGVGALGGARAPRRRSPRRGPERSLCKLACKNGGFLLYLLQIGFDGKKALRFGPLAESRWWLRTGGVALGDPRPGAAGLNGDQRVSRAGREVPVIEPGLAPASPERRGAAPERLGA